MTDCTKCGEKGELYNKTDNTVYCKDCLEVDWDENNYPNLPKLKVVRQSIEFIIYVLIGIKTYAEENNLLIKWSQELQNIGDQYKEINRIKAKFEDYVTKGTWTKCQDKSNYVSELKENMINSKIFLMWNQHKIFRNFKLSLSDTSYMENQIKIKVDGRVKEIRKQFEIDYLKKLEKKSRTLRKELTPVIENENKRVHEKEKKELKKSLEANYKAKIDELEKEVTDKLRTIRRDKKEIKQLKESVNNLKEWKKKNM